MEINNKEFVNLENMIYLFQMNVTIIGIVDQNWGEVMSFQAE